MLNEKDINLLNSMAKDEEMAQKLVDAGSYEKAYEVLTENGFTASYEEYTAYLADIRKQMEEKGLVTEDGELSAEMLDMVSGGKWYQVVGLFAAAGVAFYFGCPEGGVLLIVAGIAVWYDDSKKKKNKKKK